MIVISFAPLPTFRLHAWSEIFFTVIVSRNPLPTCVVDRLIPTATRTSESAQASAGADGSVNGVEVWVIWLIGSVATSTEGLADAVGEELAPTEIDGLGLTTALALGGGDPPKIERPMT